MPPFLAAWLTKLASVELEKLGMAIVSFFQDQYKKLVRSQGEKKAETQLQKDTDTHATRDERKQDEKNYLNS